MLLYSSLSLIRHSINQEDIASSIIYLLPLSIILSFHHPLPPPFSMIHRPSSLIITHRIIHPSFSSHHLSIHPRPSSCILSPGCPPKYPKLKSKASMSMAKRFGLRGKDQSLVHILTSLIIYIYIYKYSTCICIRIYIYTYCVCLPEGMDKQWRRFHQQARESSNHRALISFLWSPV